MRVSLLFAAAFAAISVACAGATGDVAGASGPGIREGRFERRVLLTGEVRAERGDLLSVPQLPTWQTPVRWLVEDGASVRAGDRVAEIDSGQVAGDVARKRTAVEQAEAELTQAQAGAKARVEQAEFQLAQDRDEAAKSEVSAAIPADVLPAKEYGENQLALERAKVRVGKSEADLARARAEATESAGAKRLALEQKRRELAMEELVLRAVVLTAPRDGIAVVQEHPWQGRKVQVGDSVSSGWPLVLLPDLDSLTVSAALFDVDDGEIHAGDPATCVADAFPEEKFPCRVRAVAAVARDFGVQSTRRAFQVTLDFADRQSARERLRPGMSVRAEVVAERRESARLVERAALRFRGGEAQARDARGEWRSVRLGPCNAAVCVVEDGREPERPGGGR